MKKHLGHEQEAENYLNANIDMIKCFEIIDDYYLRIYFKDGYYIEVKPEYGAIYFSLNSNE